MAEIGGYPATSHIRNFLDCVKSRAQPRANADMACQTHNTCKARVVFAEQYWIGHVNTSPTQPNLLTFCHEGPWNLVDQRVWGLDVDTGNAWKIRPTAGKETVGHEYWYADGRRIGYHGRDASGKPMIGRIRFDNEDRHETSLSGQTGHIFSHDERLIVGDGGGVIRLWRYDGREYSLPRVLCRHGSTMRTQHAHPHPRFSLDGTYVVFTTDCSGHCNVYKASITEFDPLPLADAHRSRAGTERPRNLLYRPAERAGEGDRSGDRIEPRSPRASPGRSSE